MAEAVLVDVANATKELIADHDFGIEFESAVSYADATRKLEDLTGKLHIDIVPFRSPFKFLSRGVIEYECSLDVVVRRVFTESEQQPSNGHVDVEEVNRLIKLMQDIDEFFIQDAKAQTLSSGGWQARLKSTDKKLDYDRRHLYMNDQFTGWNRVTYLAAKEIA